MAVRDDVLSVVEELVLLKRRRVELTMHLEEIARKRDEVDQRIAAADAAFDRLLFAGREDGERAHVHTARRTRILQEGTTAPPSPEQLATLMQGRAKYMKPILAMLLAHGGPLPAEQMANALGIDSENLRWVLDAIEDRTGWVQRQGRGIWVLNPDKVAEIVAYARENGIEWRSRGKGK
jgi:hypothetical protein